MRRIVIVLGVWLGAVALADAQESPAKLTVIGWLSPATTESYSQAGPGNVGLRLLVDSLARHGLVDGKNVRVDMRLAEGKLERLPGLAEALVRAGATVILAYGEPAGRAALAATRTLPIVCVADDVVDSGLAAELARPGRNLTGVSILASELDAKKIEVLRELLPRAKRFGVLNDPSTIGPRRPREMAGTAQRLGLTLQTVDVRGPDDFERAFGTFRAGGVEGVNIVASAMLTSFRRRITELSLAAKIPTICQFRNWVEAGCLASYGITVTELYELAADQIARLLRGAKPADLPVEQPRKFALHVNRRTARTLGVVIPQSVLARADEILE